MVVEIGSHWTASKTSLSSQMLGKHSEKAAGGQFWRASLEESEWLPCASLYVHVRLQTHRYLHPRTHTHTHPFLYTRTPQSLSNFIFIGNIRIKIHFASLYMGEEDFFFPKSRRKCCYLLKGHKQIKVISWTIIKTSPRAE